MPTILDKIVATKRAEIERRKAAMPEASCGPGWRLRRRCGIFSHRWPHLGRIKLIAEVKKASPSAGVIRADFDPVAIARIYEAPRGGVHQRADGRAVFPRRLEYLTQIRAAVGLPVLRKDFILDTYQLVEARVAGADAVLLIAECLDDCNLRKLFNAACELGMTPLVELYEPDNLQRVFDAGATLIGVNNRNLHTFEVDLEHTIRMRDRVPDECVLVGESGIKTHADVQRLEAAGVDAILVGESLMREADIGAAVDRLLGRNLRIGTDGGLG